MSNNEPIAFLDLVTLHKELEPELLSTLKETLQTAGFAGGPKEEEFERDFAEFGDVPYCVGVASRTDRVRFDLTSAAVKHADIVVTVPHTFIANTQHIRHADAC